MARSTISIEWNYRPCFVRGEPGLFHGWHLGEGKALIELRSDSGRVSLVSVKDFRFADSESLFKNYCFFNDRKNKCQ